VLEAFSVVVARESVNSQIIMDGVVPQYNQMISSAVNAEQRSKYYNIIR
jgi:hypothetical protein